MWFFLLFCYIRTNLSLWSPKKKFKQFILIYFFYFPLFRTSIPDSWNETNFLAHSVEFDKTFSSFFFLPLPFVSSPTTLHTNTHTHSQWVSHLYVVLYHFLTESERQRNMSKYFSYGFQIFSFLSLRSTSVKVFLSLFLWIFSLSFLAQFSLSHSHFSYSCLTCLLMMFTLRERWRKWHT